MVPARLSLRNFLCYRENCPPIDFTGIHVACLTGENGNGKSALLDAITWALWGKARARRDDDLIHLGRTEMEVEFEFLVVDQRYRVIRKRKKGTQRSAGSTSLEFHLATENGWRPLTANHVSDTEQKIRDVVKVDYETFINSAYLIQGRADEFTLKTPSDRKRILAEILGLAYYDELELAARYELNRRADQARVVESELAMADQELAHEADYVGARREIVADLEQVGQELARRAELLNSLREAQRILELQRQQLAQADRLCGEAVREVERARSAAGGLRAQIALHEAVVQHATEIRDGYSRLLDARSSEQDLLQRRTRLLELDGQETRLSAQIEAARKAIATEEEQLKTEAGRLRDIFASQAALGSAHASILESLEELSAKEARLEILRQEEQKQRESVSVLHSENKRLRDEMETIKGKQNELGGATVCPLCRTELGTEGHSHILDAYETQGRELAVDYRQNRARIEELDSRAAGSRAEIENIAQELQRRTRLDRELGTVDRQLQETKDAEARLGEVQAGLEVVRCRLENQDYAADSVQRLGEIAQQKQAVQYDAAAHRRAHDSAVECQPYEQRHRELEIAEARLEAERTALSGAESLFSEWQARQVERESEAARLRSFLEELPDASARLTEVQAEHERLGEHQRRTQQALGAIEQKLDDCARLRVRREAKAVVLKEARQEQHIYEELALAFGKRGIQAMIIDAALPEITEEANRLLARMTNNRLQVTIDTQKETQKGAVVETLDIRIADELGTRSYELFSGGEAFRVNLALRIALSKILARRAGAPLPTLAIDEGFGSQDTASRERLVGALNVIQDDFQCLLVVTHLDDLRDQFPVHIDVIKTPEGSIATVVG